jgi:hypothetical protein
MSIPLPVSLTLTYTFSSSYFFSTVIFMIPSVDVNLMALFNRLDNT